MKLELLFPLHLREEIKKVEKMTDLEEIRVRIGQPLFIYTKDRELVLVQQKMQTEMSWKDSNSIWKSDREFQILQDAYRMTEQDLLEMQNYISNYSLYAWQDELQNGFLTMKGGHRIGVAGGTASKNGSITGISYLTFFNIRVAHERIGCADKILNYLYEDGKRIYNTLLISPPGAGKTTLLRDCIRSISYGKCKIGLVDERSEIAASYHGIPQNDIGPRTDVLDGCNKPEGIQMLLRTMSPEVIAVDELGTEEDFIAVEQAAYGGCKIMGTVHAGNINELKEKTNLKKWHEKELFQRFVFIEKRGDGTRNLKVYNSRWEELC